MLVVHNNAVNLSCKYTYNLFSKEFRASLYKGADSAVEVCVVNGNHSHQLQFHSNTGFNCDGKLGNETVTFYLWNLYVNQTDIYFCKIEVMYPPPYIDNEKSNGTIIHVKGNTPHLYWCALLEEWLSTAVLQTRSWLVVGWINPKGDRPKGKSTHSKLAIFCIFLFLSRSSILFRRKAIYSCHSHII